MHYPRERARWWRWRARTCGACGVRWPCDEAKKARLRTQIKPDEIGAWGVQPTAISHIGSWSASPTMAYPQVGRAGNLTPAQARRAGLGGR